jgi:hypothetical protein
LTEAALNQDIIDFVDDYRLYFRACLKIRDKNSNIVPFATNPSQDKLVRVVEDWKRKYPRESTRPTLYIIILKARQLGFSTVTEATFYHDLCFAENMVAMIVSYDEDSAGTINDMANRFYQYTPQFLKPMTRPSRGKGIIFENPKYDPTKQTGPKNDPGLQNKFLIETARNLNAGSSYTINRLHISELAKWPNPEQTMTSLMQSVPDKNAIVIIESTAQGMNYFAQLWEAAETGQNNYVPIFVPWFEHAEYRAEYTGFELTPYEEELKDLYNLDNEQLQWRRNTIRDKLNGDETSFRQEYPCNAKESFLVTGSPAFDNEKVIRRIEILKKAYRENPPLKGNIQFDFDENTQKIKDHSIRFVADRNGWLNIFEMPKSGVPYVLGGDIAEGGLEWSTMSIIDNSTGRQVAAWRAHTDTDLYAKQVYSLGKFYNNALVSIEVNYDKHPVKELERLGYIHQYRREVIDSFTNRLEHRYGWLTNSNSRPLIIGEEVALVREEIELINDLQLLDEMLYFVRNQTGRPEHMEGKFDDSIFADSIARQARGQQTMKVIVPEKEKTIIQKHKESLLRNIKKSRFRGGLL